jgi:hypothetical protein
MQRRTILEICGGGLAFGAFWWQKIKLDHAVADKNDILARSSRMAEAAEADKRTSIDQMAAQVAHDGDYALTKGFYELSQKHPWLAATRNSVGFLRGENGCGSAVLWDRYGTIVLCDHEWGGTPLKLTFFLKDVKVETEIYDCLKDGRHDLMFASIDPKVISRNKLLPVERGKMGFEGKEAGQTIINVGFPGPSRRLHATEGTVGDLYPILDETNGEQTWPISCKIKNAGVTFRGMSGGAAFHEGRLVGIRNTGRTLGINAYGFFTPIDLITNAYCDLYPERAKLMGITPVVDELPSAPPECRIGRLDFVRGLFKTPQN